MVDPQVRAMILRLPLQLGFSHNRWYVIRKFTSLVTSARPAGALAAVRELGRVPRQYLLEAADRLRWQGDVAPTNNPCRQAGDLRRTRGAVPANPCSQRSSQDTVVAKMRSNSSASSRLLRLASVR